jgi:hypothetical protein
MKQRPFWRIRPELAVGTWVIPLTLFGDYTGSISLVGARKSDLKVAAAFGMEELTQIEDDWGLEVDWGMEKGELKDFLLASLAVGRPQKPDEIEEV